MKDLGGAGDNGLVVSGVGDSSKQPPKNGGSSVQTSMQRLPSSVGPLHLEDMEEAPVMKGLLQVEEAPLSHHGPMQIDGATKKHGQGHERHENKAHEEGAIQDDDYVPHSQDKIRRGLVATYQEVEETLEQ
ncbi:hypothetical protein L7F22_010147 [Adiantum nelumboides]|nr:hypothetical protein [Adiantum nelumboides]